MRPSQGTSSARRRARRAVRAGCSHTLRVLYASAQPGIDSCWTTCNIDAALFGSDAGDEAVHRRG